MQDFFSYYIRNRWIASCFFNLWSSCSSCPKQRRSCRLLLPPVAGCAAAEVSSPHCTPIAGLAIPLLTHIPPLLRLRRLRVIPFLGLAVVHHAGVLGTAWSMLSTNDNIGRGMYMERLTVGTHLNMRNWSWPTKKNDCNKLHKKLP